MHIKLKKQVEWYLYHYQDIKRAVLQARLDPVKKKTGGGWIQDPTGQEAVSNITPLREVYIVDGKARIHIDYPERVVEAVESCECELNAVLRELCERKYYGKQRSINCMVAMGLTRDVYYAAINELLQIMSLYMVEHRVLKISKK